MSRTTGVRVEGARGRVATDGAPRRPRTRQFEGRCPHSSSAGAVARDSPEGRSEKIVIAYAPDNAAIFAIAPTIFETDPPFFALLYRRAEPLDPAPRRVAEPSFEKGGPTMANKKRGKVAASTRAEDLGAGTAKHYTNPAQVLAFDGASLAVSGVTAKLQRVVTLRANTEAAQAAAREAVAAEENELPALQAFMTSYTAFVRATFGNSPTVLADFGLAPKKAHTPPSPAAKVAAAAKRKATRAARGTTGPKKKLSVKGNVTGVEITPVTAPSAAASPQPSPQPAANGGSAAPANGGTPPAHG